MLCIRFSLTLAFVLTQTQALASSFETGDQINCYDRVSSAVSTIKITGVSPLSAQVQFEGKTEHWFYPADSTKVQSGVSELHEELTIEMFHDDELAETIVLSDRVKLGSTSEASYMDRGDSRGLNCELKKGRIFSFASPYVPDLQEVAQLSYSATKQFALDASRLKILLPESLAAVSKHPELKGRYLDLEHLVRISFTKETAETYVQSIDLQAVKKDHIVTVWISGPADERYSSQFQFTIEYDEKTKTLRDISNVEYIPHS